MRKAGRDPEELNLPVLEHGAYLVELLFEAGPGGGGEPLDYQEIRAWADVTGTRLTRWEAVALRSLSVAYMTERMMAKRPERLPPYSQLTDARDTVHAKMKNAFAILKGGRRDRHCQS